MLLLKIGDGICSVYERGDSGGVWLLSTWETEPFIDGGELLACEIVVGAGS